MTGSAILAILAFFVLAGIGAVVRWMAGHRWPGRHWGTLLVNVVGAFLLGLLAGSGASAATMTIVGTGGLGALTTFSRFAQDAGGLAEDSASPTRNAAGRSNPTPRTAATLYVGGTLLLGLAAAWLGLEISG
mgnify:FL=1